MTTNKQSFLTTREDISQSFHSVYSRWLITALHEAHKADVIDNLRSILVSPTTPPQPSTTQHPTLVWYSGYLKERHSQVHIAVVSNKWLPSPTRKIFNLAIIKKERIQRGKIDDEFVRKTIRGQVDDILLKKSPIELEKLFMNIEGERKVILIDGAPGSGKSTLTVHICQRWSRGELFQEFTIVILVQLRDPGVQSAQSIANLIPCPDIESAQQVASAIKANLGRGILWVLDGWDELPSHLREKSFLREMITPSLHSPITQSSVIVTSRPISSGELSELVSSRIEVLGFTWEEQRQYFIECLKGDTKAVDTLIERLSENPAIEGSCYLPLNASIVAHLYLSDGSLPRTVHGIFSSLVQHCLSHYLCERLGKTQQQARITSLNSLPQELQASFNQLCKLAFIGISQNKVTFAHSDLEAIKDSAVVCEVGLLQATPSILSDGRTVYYNFIHLSIQEMLSAVYISRMPASKQISTFDSLFRDSRFSAVFQFYAAITKLRTSRPFLSKLPRRLCPVPAGVLDLVRKIIKKQRSRPLLVSLLHCLYEAQDPSLCQFVAEQLESGLYLRDTSLTPVDSLAIGYFLSSVSLTTSNAKEFRVVLFNCSLGDAGTKNLMQNICRSIDPHSTVNTHINMSLGSNEIHEEGASHIAEILNSTSIVSTLVLCDSIGDKGLQTIFDALKQNKTLKHLNVSDCGMTNTGVASLADALHTNNTLETLYINDNKIHEEGASHIAEILNSTSIVSTLRLGGNPIGDKGLQTIFDALKQNKTLKFLHITNCDMTDTGVASLADALHTNNTLEELHIHHNEAITENGLTCLAEALSRHSKLVKLSIPWHFGVDKVWKIINEARKRNGLPDIIVH